MTTVGAIGLGRLGLCFALTLERAGFNVVGCDIEESKLEAIRNKTFQTREPSVESYLKGATNFTVTSDISEVLRKTNIIFATVRTDSKVDGRFDHSQIDVLVETLKSMGHQPQTKYLVVCSNVMPGYSDTVHERLKDLNYKVSYSPELVAQGRILEDQKNPDMIVIGEADKKSGDIIHVIYRTVCGDKPKIHRMSRISAELFKISLNCYMTTKITFANIVGDTALRAGAEPDKILAAIGDDSRIGKKYFSHGFGYGGPCFGRDNQAFIQFAKSIGIDPIISEAVINSNKLHLDYQVEYFCKTHKPGSEVVMPYVTYKPGVTILMDSQQLFFAVALAHRGYRVVIEDHPEVISQVKEMYGDLFVYREPVG